jgi:hypothetical protein
MRLPTLAQPQTLTNRHEAKWISVEFPNEAYDAIKSMKVSSVSRLQLERQHLKHPKHT